ncbi:alpha/beta hydrolase [Aeromicrobium sp. NPDC092404]|uniref:alpha/beta fold hydrolase n=1 Tax=Aeromicrobium sp. NPDC092404 TaxID=3154976 RepID=UPI0034235B3E
MSRTAKVATTAGAFVAAGVVASVLNGRQRHQRRLRRGEDVVFGSVHSDPVQVTASDGVQLNVEVDEAESRTPTVVFVHGWVESIDVWHYQRLALRGKVRMVFVDLRSHGASGRSTRTRSTLAQLADDLRSVIAAQVPRGPIVLVGHSMGGMAIMELAAAEPQQFSRRVKGVVLLSTSSGRLMRSSPALRYLVPLLRVASPVLDWGRTFNSYSIVRRWGLGPNAQERHVDMTNELILASPTHVLMDFYPLFVTLDTTAGLEVIGRSRTVVVGGTADLITPIKHSRRLAQAIPGATLVALEDAGHMVMFEEHQRVTRVIEDVLEATA